MKNKRFGFIIITLIFTTVIILVLYYLSYLSAPEKTVQRFLDNLIVNTTGNLYSYLDRHVDDKHPFIELILERNPFTGFKINETKTISNSTFRSMVTLYLKQGSVNIPITLEKTGDKWLIQSLPTVVHLPAAIP